MVKPGELQRSEEWTVRGKLVRHQIAIQIVEPEKPRTVYDCQWAFFPGQSNGEGKEVSRSNIWIEIDE